MVPDMLNIPVHDYYLSQAPAGYVNMAKLLEEKRRKKNGEHNLAMEWNVGGFEMILNVFYFRGSSHCDVVEPFLLSDSCL